MLALSIFQSTQFEYTRQFAWMTFLGVFFNISCHVEHLCIILYKQHFKVKTQSIHQELYNLVHRLLLTISVCELSEEH